MMMMTTTTTTAVGLTKRAVVRRFVAATSATTAPLSMRKVILVTTTTTTRLLWPVSNNDTFGSPSRPLALVPRSFATTPAQNNFLTGVTTPSTISSSTSVSPPPPSSSHDNGNNHHTHRGGPQQQPQQQQQQQQQRHQQGGRRRRRLDVAIVGAPNAGKSQLLNVLTRAPIAAVSRKRHTTRTGDILGARTTTTTTTTITPHREKQKMDDNHNSNNNKYNKTDQTSSSTATGTTTTTTTQIVFKDTPGFLRLEDAKEERLDRDLIVTAAAEMQHVDFTLIVVDAARTLTDHYQHALVQLMVGALGSHGRIEEEEDEDDEDDDDDDDIDIEVDDRDAVDDNHHNSSTNDNAVDPVKGVSTTMKDQLTTPTSTTIAPKFAVVLNKIDLVKDKFDLLPLAETIGTLADACLLDRYGPDILTEMNTDRLMDVVPITFYVSALEEDGTDELFEYLVELATPCQSWAVPLGQTTNQTPLEQVQEVIREKIYRCTHREVPHSVEQVNRLFETKQRRRRQVRRQMGHHDGHGDDDKNTERVLVVHQDLVVFTKSHQRLVTGNAGRTLQRIQESAQRDLQTLFGCDVLLELHVKLNKSKQQRRAGDG